MSTMTCLAPPDGPKGGTGRNGGAHAHARDGVDDAAVSQEIRARPDGPPAHEEIGQADEEDPLVARKPVGVLDGGGQFQFRNPFPKCRQDRLVPRVDGLAGPAQPLDLTGLLHLALLQGDGGNVDEVGTGTGLPQNLVLLGRQDVEFRADLSGPSRRPGQGACENLLEPPLFCQFLPADEDVLHGKLEPAPYIEGVIIGGDEQAGGLGRPRVVEDIAGINEKGRVDAVGGSFCRRARMRCSMTVPPQKLGIGYRENGRGMSPLTPAPFVRLTTPLSHGGEREIKVKGPYR